MDATFEYRNQVNKLGLHPHTVSQKLNALAEGGVSVNMTATGAIARTGRPKKLARI